MVLLQRKLYFSKVQSGFNISQGEGGGVQILISIGTHIICDFPGGSGPPIRLLDPHMDIIHMG